jgi:hypothetical protein
MKNKTTNNTNTNNPISQGDVKVLTKMSHPVSTTNLGGIVVVVGLGKHLPSEHP